MLAATNSMKKESLESLTAEDWGNLFPIKIDGMVYPVLFSIFFL